MPPASLTNLHLQRIFWTVCQEQICFSGGSQCYLAKVTNRRICINPTHENFIFHIIYSTLSDPENKRLAWWHAFLPNVQCLCWHHCLSCSILHSLPLFVAWYLVLRRSQRSVDWRRCRCWPASAPAAADSPDLLLMTLLLRWFHLMTADTPEFQEAGFFLMEMATLSLSQHSEPLERLTEGSTHLDHSLESSQI